MLARFELIMSHLNGPSVEFPPGKGVCGHVTEVSSEIGFTFTEESTIGLISNYVLNLPSTPS